MAIITLAGSSKIDTTPSSGRSCNDELFTPSYTRIAVKQAGNQVSIDLLHAQARTFADLIDQLPLQSPSDFPYACQIGESFWKTILREHGMDDSGVGIAYRPVSLQLLSVHALTICIISRSPPQSRAGIYWKRPSSTGECRCLLHGSRRQRVDHKICPKISTAGFRRGRV